MNGKIIDSSPTRKIKTEPGAIKIDPDFIAEALGAEIVTRDLPVTQDPVSRIALHQHLAATHLGGKI